MKKAIHFGAGNIGRGFIGLLLNKSGYEVTFVDVNADLVNDINELGKYNIEIVGDNPEIIQVDNVKAINSANTIIPDRKKHFTALIAAVSMRASVIIPAISAVMAATKPMANEAPSFIFT